MRNISIKTKFIPNSSLIKKGIIEFQKYVNDLEFDKVKISGDKVHKTSIIEAVKLNGDKEIVVLVGLSLRKISIDRTIKENRDKLIIDLDNRKLTQRYIAQLLFVSQSLVSKVIKENNMCYQLKGS